MRTHSHDYRAIAILRCAGAIALGAYLVVGSLSGAIAQEPLGSPVETPDSAAEPNEALPTPDGAPDAEPDAAPSDPGATGVGLDQLLRLPNSLDFKEERRGGGGAADWRRRFGESERALRDARAKLEETEGAMAEAGTAGSGQWQITPPGQQASSGDNGPLSFKLREELRRARAAVEAAERQHRALIVEADLANVPQAWRQTATQ